jgi:SAM-dependent methyltransferase
MAGSKEMLLNADLSGLVDPDSRAPLALRDASRLVGPGGESHPVVGGIPRFVPDQNYAAAFGAQWRMFPHTQLDSRSGLPISETRLARCMRGRLPDVAGKRVLEAGSGAGRFTEVLLAHGAILCSFDYSSAVEANASNNGQSPHLTLVQADIRKIPFPRESFDYVVCLGVLQHTPDPEQSIAHLYDMVAPGGCLVIDHYRRKRRELLAIPRKLYRRVILRLPAERQFPVVKKLVDFWFPIHWRFRDSLTLQRILRRLSPVHFYYPDLGLASREKYYEWALLDTNDSNTDYYRHTRTVREIEQTLQQLGAEGIVADVGGNGVEAFCIKPRAARPASDPPLDRSSGPDRPPRSAE